MDYFVCRRGAVIKCGWKPAGDGLWRRAGRMMGQFCGGMKAGLRRRAEIEERSWKNDRF